MELKEQSVNTPLNLPGFFPKAFRIRYEAVYYVGP